MSRDGNLFLTFKFKNMKNYIESVVYEALPKANISYTSNFDEVHYGWLISPQPGVLIKFLVSLDNPLVIDITTYLIDSFTDSLSVKKLYYGKIPPNDDFEPDYDFVKKLLKNWSYMIKK